MGATCRRFCCRGPTNIISRSLVFQAASVKGRIAEVAHDAVGIVHVFLLSSKDHIHVHSFTRVHVSEFILFF